MKLKNYRTEVAKVSRAIAGKALGVDGVTVYRWETGRSFPNLAAIKSITEWSGGKVTANDLVSVERERA